MSVGVVLIVSAVTTSGSKAAIIGKCVARRTATRNDGIIAITLTGTRNARLYRYYCEMKNNNHQCVEVTSNNTSTIIIIITIMTYDDNDALVSMLLVHRTG